MIKFLVSESYQTDALWRNFTEHEIREKSKKIRKLSVERWKVIDEADNVMDGFQRPSVTQVGFELISRLIHACQTGDENEVLMLIRAGVNVNARGPKEQTPLQIAARHNHPRVMLHLLRSGAEVDAFDMDGWTALHYAAYYDHYSVLLLLLEAEANTFSLDVDLNYPINHVRDNSPLLITMTNSMRTKKAFSPAEIREKHTKLLNEQTMKMIFRAEKAQCFITGLKDRAFTLTLDINRVVEARK